MRFAPCVFSVAALLVGPAALADAVELPYEGDVHARRLEVDLRDGQVSLLVDPDARPSVRVTDLLQEENQDGFAVIEEVGAVLRIGQPHGDEHAAPRLLVKLVLRPETEVLISGQKVTVSAEFFGAREVDLPIVGDPSAPQPQRAVRDTGRASSGSSDDDPTPSVPAPGAVPPAPGRPLLNFDVRDSSVSVVGLPVTITAVNTHARLENIRGLVKADLNGGDLQVEGLVGALDVRMARTDLTIGRVWAAVQFAGEDGTLRVAGGVGTIRGQGRTTGVSVENWAGPFRYQGDYARIELRQVGGTEATLISGKANDIQLEQLAGPFDLDLDGGQLQGRALLDAGSMNAHGQAILRLEGIKANLTLRLAENAQAELRTVERMLILKADTARVDLTGIRELSLEAANSNVTARDLGTRADIRASDSELQFDLGRFKGNPTFDLRGATHAKIALAAPCYVRSDEDAGDRLVVTGCELQDRTHHFAVSRMPGTAQPVFASAKLDESATAEFRAGM